MKITILLFLLPALAFADPPTDAPLSELPGRSVRLEPGQPAPFAGQLLSDEEHVASEKVCADDHAFRHEALGGSKLLLTPLQLVAIVAGAVAVGAAVSAGVIVATRR